MFWVNVLKILRICITYLINYNYENIIHLKIKKIYIIYVQRFRHISLECHISGEIKPSKTLSVVGESLQHYAEHYQNRYKKLD